MRLTRRGKAVALVLLFTFTMTVAWITAPYGIDYYAEDGPRVVDLRDMTRNNDDVRQSWARADIDDTQPIPIIKEPACE